MGRPRLEDDAAKFTRRSLALLMAGFIFILALACFAPKGNARPAFRSEKVQAAQLILFVIQQFHSCGDQPAKLAAFMIRVNHVVVWDAQQLACTIYREAGKRRLDPAVLAAIVWNESWFDRRSKGSSGEFGYWQIWPGARKDVGWYVSWSQAQKRSLKIEDSTIAAAKLLARLVHWCGKRHKNHRRPTDAYAHFNTGYRWPRPGYSAKLWKRTQKIRAMLGRVTVTGEELAWLNRSAYTQVP